MRKVVWSCIAVLLVVSGAFYQAAEYSSHYPDSSVGQFLATAHRTSSYYCPWSYLDATTRSAEARTVQRTHPCTPSFPKVDNQEPELADTSFQATYIYDRPGQTLTQDAVSGSGCEPASSTSAGSTTNEPTPAGRNRLLGTIEIRESDPRNLSLLLDRLSRNNSQRGDFQNAYTGDDGASESRIWTMPRSEDDEIQPIMPYVEDKQDRRIKSESVGVSISRRQTGSRLQNEPSLGRNDEQEPASPRRQSKRKLNSESGQIHRNGGCPCLEKCAVPSTETPMPRVDEDMDSAEMAIPHKNSPSKRCTKGG